MIGRALDAGAAASWVAADEVYGHDSQLRRFLEGRQMAYVLAVASEQRLWQSDFMQHRVDAIALNLPASRWKRLSAGLGSKGEQLYDWALMVLSKQDGWTRALLVRRSIEEKPECAYYLCYAPSGKDTLEALVRVAGERWKIGQTFQTAKANVDWITTKCVTGRAGIGISRWPCWPTLCYPCCEHTEEKTPDAQVRLSVPELRHLLTALLWRGWHGLEHLRHWSQWRRRHQFQAHVLPLSKARFAAANTLSTTVVLKIDMRSH